MVKMFDDDTFQGACVDYGAENSVIGTDKARDYHKMNGSRLQMDPQSISFKFGNIICKRDGFTDVRMPVSDNCFISFKENVVKVDITMLVRFD